MGCGPPRVAHRRTTEERPRRLELRAPDESNRSRRTPTTCLTWSQRGLRHRFLPIAGSGHMIDGLGGPSSAESARLPRHPFDRLLHDDPRVRKRERQSTHADRRTTPCLGLAPRTFTRRVWAYASRPDHNDFMGPATNPRPIAPTSASMCVSRSRRRVAEQRPNGSRRPPSSVGECHAPGQRQVRRGDSRAGRLGSGGGGESASPSRSR